MVLATEYLTSIALIFVLIITRNLHEIVASEAIRDADGYVHMVIAREFRKNKHRTPKEVSASVFDWTFSYPYLLHLLLSFFPERYYEFIDRLFPTIMDVLYVGLLITLVPLGFLSTGDIPLLIALFVTTPQFIQYSAGKGLSARKPGILLATCSLLLFVMWSTGGSNLILFASIIFAGLTHLTSRFGTQVVIFFYTGFIFLSPVAFFIIISSLIIAILLSGGTYLKVFKSHLLFWYDFATRKQFAFLYDGFKSVDTVRRFVSSRSLSDLFSAIYESVLLKALLNNPYAIGTSILIIWSLQSPMISVPNELVIWFGIGLIVCILTTLYGLRFLGQPGRYLNYTFIPGSLIIIEGLQTAPIMNELFISFIVIIGLSMIAGQALAYRRLGASPEQHQTRTEAIDYLKSNNADRILVQPRHLGSEIAWKTDASVTDYFGDGYCSRMAADEAGNIFVEEPYITEEFAVIDKVVDPDLVLFEKKSVQSTRDECLSPPDVDPLFENEYYSIYSWSSFGSDRHEHSSKRER
jgi:hypothetical protein